MIIVTIYLCYFLVFLHIEMPSFNVYKKKLVDIPRYLDANIWKYIFVLGKSKWKSNFARLAKITETAIKEWIFFCFRTGQNICRHHRDTICQFHFVYGGEKEKHASKLVFYIFFLLSNCPKFKVKKRYGRPWKSKYAHVVVVPFLRNLRVAYHKFFISITTTYLHSVVKFKKKFCYFCSDSTLSTRFKKL